MARYPATVTDYPTYMIFTFHKHQGYKTDQLKGAEKFGYTAETYGSIGLPVPNNLNDALSLDWSAEFDQSYVTQMAQAATGYVAGGKGRQEALFQTGTNFERHSAMIFNGVGTKTYNFFWTMTPQSKQEAEQIALIINRFEEASLPSLTAGANMFGAPDIVRVKFAGKNKFKGMEFLPCVITGVNVKYGSDVTFMVYQDGNPPEVQLSIQLSEVTSRNRIIHQRLKGKSK